jgi:hypothetical protein
VRYFALLIALIVSISAQAKSVSPQTSLANGDILHGAFTETRHMHGFNGPMATNGHFTVAPGFGLIWDTEKPFAITTIITPTGLRQNIGGEQITNLDAAKMPFLLRLYETLGGALAGDTQSLDKDFIVTRSQKNGSWIIDLQPRQTDSIAMPFSAIHITGSQFIDSVHMTRNDGDSEDITFQNQSVRHAAPDAAELKNFGGI